MQLWQQAEELARQRTGATDAREGEVLAEVCAAYLGAESPLEGEVQ